MENVDTTLITNGQWRPIYFDESSRRTFHPDDCNVHPLYFPRAPIYFYFPFFLSVLLRILLLHLDPDETKRKQKMVTNALALLAVAPPISYFNHAKEIVSLSYICIYFRVILKGIQFCPHRAAEYTREICKSVAVYIIWGMRKGDCAIFWPMTNQQKQQRILQKPLYAWNKVTRFETAWKEFLITADIFQFMYILYRVLFLNEYEFPIRILWKTNLIHEKNLFSFSR